MSVRRGSLLLSLPVAVALTLSTSGSGGGTVAEESPWGPAERVSPVGAAVWDDAQVLLDPAGRATAVLPDLIRTRAADGRWRTSGDPARHPAWYTPSAVAGDGSVTVLWTGAGDRVMAATRQPGHRWSRPETLSRPVPEMAEDCNAGTYHHVLAAGADGAAVALWEWGSWDCGPVRLQAAYRPADGTWGRTYTFPIRMVSAAAGVDGEGNAVVVAHHRRETLAARKPVGRPWTEPVPLVHGGSLAVGADGTTVLTWLREDADGSSQLVASSWLRGSRWGAPVTLATEPFTWLPPVIGIDDEGTATIAWETAANTVLATRLGTDGSWEEPTTVAGTGREVWSLGVAVDGAGDAVLAWGRKRHLLQAAFRPAGGSWGLVEDVSKQSPFVVGPRIAADGDSLVAWVNREDVVRARWREAD